MGDAGKEVAPGLVGTSMGVPVLVGVGLVVAVAAVVAVAVVLFALVYPEHRLGCFAVLPAVLRAAGLVAVAAIGGDG